MKHIEVMRKWCKKIGIKIFDKWDIPLDHVTYNKEDKECLQVEIKKTGADDVMFEFRVG